MSLKDTPGFEGLNVIPMIDVMLVLLTIVLTTASFIATGKLPVELPEASAAPRREEDEPMRVEIEADGTIRHGGEVVSLDTLRRRLDPVGRETPIWLRADRKVAFQFAVEVLDLLRTMRFRKLAIETSARRGAAR
ncbi:MAG: biopolymer transporter ExbD [Candidatus Accumulibacter sp.]|jgi:biopolymer transport protein ExbD|nr:biopolymer transporter ExbD [Accumulibacter sp.]